MSNKLDFRIFYKRNLPHIQPENAVLFITYRLAFSLPKEILSILLEKRKVFDKQLVKVDPIERKKLENIYNKVLFQKEDEFLDKYISEPLWLKNKEITRLIIDSFLYNHQKLYELHFALIMPNHVHTVLKPLQNSNKQYFSIAKIMKEHKSYTAIESNKILKRNGQFWHHESYDHYIRDDEEYYRIKNYVFNNPVNAGLVERIEEWKDYIVDVTQSSAL